MRSVFKAIKQKIPGTSNAAASSTSTQKLSVKPNFLQQQSNDGKNRSRFEQVSPNNSPSGIINIKPEYYILDLTVELKDLTSGYEFNLQENSSFDINSYPSYSLGNSKLNNSSSSLSDQNLEQTDNQNEEVEARRKDIEKRMYSTLCSLNSLVCREPVLEQYVLRELRHLQEFLAHRYPPIAAYLKIPFEETIHSVRSRTKGLSLYEPYDPSLSQAKSAVLSPPTPRKQEQKQKLDGESGSPRVSKKINKNSSRQRNNSTGSNNNNHNNNNPVSSSLDSSSPNSSSQDSNRSQDEYGFYDEGFE